MKRMFSTDRATTTTGVSLIAYAAGLVLTAVFDGDPETVPDWNTILPMMIAGLTGVFARDREKPVPAPK